jgi:hypothetical protein
MSLKMHFIHSQLDPFPVSSGAIQGQTWIYHQDISMMKNRYKGKWSAAMLGSECWMVKRGALEIQYK